MEKVTTGLQSPEMISPKATDKSMLDLLQSMSVSFDGVLSDMLAQVAPGKIDIASNTSSRVSNSPDSKDAGESFADSSRVETLDPAVEQEDEVAKNRFGNDTDKSTAKQTTAELGLRGTVDSVAESSQQGTLTKETVELAQTTPTASEMGTTSNTSTVEIDLNVDPTVNVRQEGAVQVDEAAVAIQEMIGDDLNVSDKVVKIDIQVKADESEKVNLMLAQTKQSAVQLDSTTVASTVEADLGDVEKLIATYGKTADSASLVDAQKVITPTDVMKQQGNVAVSAKPSEVVATTPVIQDMLIAEVVATEVAIAESTVDTAATVLANAVEKVSVKPEVIVPVQVNEQTDVKVAQVVVQAEQNVLQAATQATSQGQMNNGNSQQQQAAVPTPSGVEGVQASGPEKGGSFVNTLKQISSQRGVNQAETINKIASMIKNSGARMKQTLTMRLNPHNLGQIRINMTVKGQALHLNIVTESGAATEVLVNGAQELKSALAESGIQLGEYDVQSELSHGQSEQTHDGQSFVEQQFDADDESFAYADSQLEEHVAPQYLSDRLDLVA